jgi:hypothetical protein
VQLLLNNSGCKFRSLIKKTIFEDIKMARNKRKILSLYEPILYPDHKLPVTRRDFLNAGFITSAATVMMPSIFSLLFSKQARAIDTLPDVHCGIVEGSAGGSGKIPFMCFDLGGGANMAGSNVLVGQQGGQLDPLSAAGYNKMGLPTAMTPLADPATVNTELGLAFHADSAFLRGIISKTSPECRANVNGAVIPARSDNDTGNNPHNPMYGIAKASADGELLTLIGTTNSDSGGRSMAPASMMDPTIRPTKISSRNDTRGLVDTGAVSALMPDPDEAGRIMKAVEKISLAKIDGTTTDSIPQDVLPESTTNMTVQNLVHCGYLKTTKTVSSFGGPGDVDPAEDPVMITSTPPGTADNLSDDATLRAAVTDSTGIFTQDEVMNGRLASTAAVLKLVGPGYAGAGTVSLGGYDYHNGTRGTGEVRDFEAGQAIGACLQYAHKLNKPIMVYVFTDGSLASNGNVDDGDQNGRGKGVWTGDNSSTSAAFFLVYKPGGRPELLSTTGQTAAQHQQLGHFRASGSVETNGTTPGANSPNLLAEMCVLNYLALHNEIGRLSEVLPNHSLGSTAADFEKLVAFNAIVNGTITNPM